MKRIYLAVLATAALSYNPAVYVSADQNYNADNTAENVRDRNEVNPTAQDQSNRKADIKVTAKLRREIVRTRGLSVDAQNIKIIDQNGCVVLRGPVDSEHEKTVIEDLARKCCGVNFKNELEVKTP